MVRGVKGKNGRPNRRGFSLSHMESSRTLNILTLGCAELDWKVMEVKSENRTLHKIGFTPLTLGIGSY